MEKRRRVVGAWDVGFHSMVQEARKRYARELNKPNLSDIEVTRIWSDRRLTNFKIPKLKLRKGYKAR